jgi:hypothetical protein
MEDNEDFANSIRMLADAICPIHSVPGHDSAGGYVSSLTEATMGITTALMRVADVSSTGASGVHNVSRSLDRVADAISGAAPGSEIMSVAESLDRIADAIENLVVALTTKPPVP